MGIYNQELNSAQYTCLNRLTIAKVTSGRQVSAVAYTGPQLLRIQRLARQLHPDKNTVIAYR